MRIVVVAALALLLTGCSESAVSDPEPTFSEDLDDDLKATQDTGVIRGVVVDEAVAPVVDVTVRIQGTGQETATNEQGAFGFAGLEPGTYFLTTQKIGFNGTQTSVEVVAGVDRPDIVKILVTRDPGQLPFVESRSFQGFLACGFAVFYTSVGCTTNGFLASNTDSTSIWSLDYDRLPMWTQGELVWEDTQPASGQFIWQIVQSEYPGTPQPHIGYMETTPSPALTYLDTAVIDEYADWILETGIDYRFFAGPHEACPQHVGDPSVNRFGCGATLDQSTEVFIHEFYNAVPEDGWRFTQDGAPVVG